VNVQIPLHDHDCRPKRSDTPIIPNARRVLISVPLGRSWNVAPFIAPWEKASSDRANDTHPRATRA